MSDNEVMNDSMPSPFGDTTPKEVPSPLMTEGVEKELLEVDSTETLPLEKEMVDQVFEEVDAAVAKELFAEDEESDQCEEEEQPQMESKTSLDYTPLKAVYGRVDGTTYSSPRYVNTALLCIAEVLNKENKTGETAIDDIITVPGANLRSSGNPGLWTESLVQQHSRTFMFVAGANLERTDAVYYKTSYPNINKRAALMEPRVGQHIVFAHKNRYGFFILIYRITEVLTEAHSLIGNEIPKMNRPRPRFTAEFVHAATYNNAVQFNKAMDDKWDERKDSEVQWNDDVEHERLIKTAGQSLESDNIDYYVREYTEYLFDPKEYQSCVNDTAFMATLRRADDGLSFIYEDLSRAFSAQPFDRMYRRQLTITVAYYPEADRVFAFFMATMFNVRTKTSAGRRICYLRAEIKPDSNFDSFWYPDQDMFDSVDFDTLKSNLIKAGNVLSSKFVRSVA